MEDRLKARDTEERKAREEAEQRERKYEIQREQLEAKRQMMREIPGETAVGTVDEYMYKGGVKEELAKLGPMTGDEKIMAGALSVTVALWIFGSKFGIGSVASALVGLSTLLITGVIKTTKMKNTIIIRKDYLHYIKKYQRFEKRHKNTPVHVSPAFRLKPGDEILAGQCRPISKTVRFNVLKVIRSSDSKDKKGF